MSSTYIIAIYIRTCRVIAVCNRTPITLSSIIEINMQLIASHRGNEAPLPWPPPCKGLVLLLPYVNVESPYPVLTRCVICWMLNSIHCITGMGTPNLRETREQTG